MADIPTRVCEFPYSSYGAGLLALVCVGGLFLFTAFISVIVLIWLAYFKKDRDDYIMLREGYESYEREDKGTDNSVKIVAAILILSFIIGVVCFSVGGTIMYWSRLYGQFTDCSSLITLTAQRPLPSTVTTTPINLTIAFVGDSGATADSLKVYRLIKKNAEMLIHMGDFDYCDDPGLFHYQVDAVLGKDFPMVAAIGNHDIYKWPEYEKELHSHFTGHGNGTHPGLVCEGLIGVNYWCMYKGVFVAFSSVGTMCGGGYSKYGYHESELQRNLEVSRNLSLAQKPWTVCAWHKNQKYYQVGGKKNEVGYGVYDICRKYGALIMTGHEHSFSRSKPIDIVETQHFSQSCGGNPNCAYNLTDGTTIVTVTGLGGRGMRKVDATLGALPHWDSTFADNHGVLFCKFNYNGNENLAYCYFLDIDGNQHDTFFMTRG